MASWEEMKAAADELKRIVSESGLEIEFEEPGEELKKAVSHSFPLPERARADYIFTVIRSNYPDKLKIVVLKDRNETFGKCIL